MVKTGSTTATNEGMPLSQPSPSPNSDRSPPTPSSQPHTDSPASGNGQRPTGPTALDFLATRIGQQKVRKLFELGLNELQIKLNRDQLADAQIGFTQWLSAARKDVESRVRSINQLSREKWLQGERTQGPSRQDSQAPRFVCDFLVWDVQQHLDRLRELKALNRQFRRNTATATTVKDRQEITLHYASELSGDGSVGKDEAAFARWFDEEALSDRFLQKIGELELSLCFRVGRLAQATLHVFYRAIEFSTAATGGNLADQVNRVTGIWQRLNVESTLLSVLVYDGDVRVHVAAIGGLRVMLKGLLPSLAAQLLSQRMLSFIDRAARQKNSDVWIQCEALTILAALSFPLAQKVMRQRLENPALGDDLFVRQHIWALVQERLKQLPEETIELPALHDPSPFVRQKMATAAFYSDTPAVHRQWWDSALTDDDPKVRAAALTVGLNRQFSFQQFINFFKILPHVLRSEQDPFVLRAAFHCSHKSIGNLYAKIEASQGAGSSKFTAPSQTKFTAISVVQKDILPAILEVQQQHPSLPVRRFAGQASEQIWALMQPKIRQLMLRLKPELKKIKVGRSRRFPLAWFDWIDDVTLGRLFAVLSQDDFGYDIKKGIFGVRVTRGPSFGFRLWRFLFEFAHPASDKRQAHRHTIGRISTATLRAPSQITGELSQTKVPGEPLVIAADGTWRPFLPLPDDFVSALNLSWFKPRTVRFVSSQGVTQLTAPETIGQRLKAGWKLTTRLAKLAQPRNLEGDAVQSRQYLQAFEEMGFKIEFQAHRHHTASPQSVRDASNSEQQDDQDDRNTGAHCHDSSVEQFFAAGIVLIPTVALTAPLAWFSFLSQTNGGGLSEWGLGLLQRFSSYFTSLFENSLEELVLFAAVVFVFAIARHLWANFSFRKSRDRIPMVLGGWGTRGKSGTERLKAALINRMGYGLVSKTTGCEAMFIHSTAFGEPLEIPLFRPYDKATIWEQKNLICMTDKLKASVFLWECMALNPAYVNLLQHQWMHDDISTITNTYPDHEDVQGPAGYNVAETIAGFVPKRSIMITTEEQMRPYIADRCRDHNTELQGVGWLESGLITDDILQRFPYQEHPDNIALVARMAENLGVPQNQSFKAMADDLIPDLGVLKTHPVSQVRNRKIEFTNGMSANERFGCMGNWKRLGYAQQSHLDDPATWVCAVVNNRADRVPRSKVFANVIVNDLSADRFFLIGTNLNGLQKFISEAWEEKEQTLTLRHSDGSWDTQYAISILQKSAIDFRQPISNADVLARLKVILHSVVDAVDDRDALEDSLANFPDEAQLELLLQQLEISDTNAKTIVGHYQRWAAAVDAFEEMKEIIVDAPATIADTVDEKFRLMLRKWFQLKIIVVRDSEATGEEIITRIIEEIPQGHLARIMGLQNIKGTGLDFVYRFHAWDVCHDACEATQSRQLVVAENALRTLVAMPEIGQLCIEKIRRTIALCRASKILQRSDLQLLVDQLQNRLTGLVGADSPHEPQQENQPLETPDQLNVIRAQFKDWMVEWSEQFLDVNDSIRRREKAELIYRDLLVSRISRQRAVLELRKLNKRQKGGWLKEDSRKVRDLVAKVGRWS